MRIEAMSRGRILIVEDEFLVAAEVEATLEERGFESVGIAPDMEAALALAAAKPDLALVDIHLRDGPTGPEIAQRLARDYGVNVLFVTANPNMVAPPQAEKVLGVLEKPCEDGLLGAAIDYIMAKNDQPLPAPPGLRLLGEPG